MGDIDNLRVSVAQTLQRAHSRTRVGRRPKAHVRGAVLAPVVKDLRPYPVEDALEEQQEICAEIRREIDRVRSQGRDLATKARRERSRCDLLEQKLEVVEWRIEHAHKRRVELERRLQGHRESLQGTVDSRKAATRALLQARERVAGLTARLKNAE